ncbi:type II toxin-antitoxin system PemK/MazF family toxin [Actinoplanes sp. CA-252034]|uniref:type II toxin-antitoxin system PemK/MazF family toxin n=1 Tax=Actinoplanes sp. CA-252034 TaxID=3239906 RepID=UPI003D951668
MDLLSGTGALVVITVVIVGVLFGVILGDRIGLLLRPIGLIVAPMVVILYAGAALLMSAPADLLIEASPSTSAIGLTLLVAGGVALLTARRLRPRRAEPASALWLRALLLLSCCSGTRYLAHVAGYPVDGFWPAAAVSLAALTLTAAVFAFLRLPGVLPLVVRAFAALVTAGLVAAWARANGVPVFADPATASSRTLWVMLLVEPLGLLAAILLAVALVRHFAPDVLPVRERVPRAGEIWNAFVTFENDDSLGKDRPVLVVSAGETVSVLKITSQDKGHLPGYLPLPRNRVRGVLVKDSWLELKPVTVPPADFRSYRGSCPSWLRDDLRGRELMAAVDAPGRLRGWLAAIRSR